MEQPEVRVFNDEEGGVGVEYAVPKMNECVRVVRVHELPVVNVNYRIAVV